MMNIKIILLLSLAAYALCGDNKTPENKPEFKKQKIESEASGSESPKTLQEILKEDEAKAMEESFKEALSYLQDNNINEEPNQITLTHFMVFASNVDGIISILSNFFKEVKKTPKDYDSLDSAKFGEVVKHICKTKNIYVQQFLKDRQAEGLLRRKIQEEFSRFKAKNETKK